MSAPSASRWWKLHRGLFVTLALPVVFSRAETPQTQDSPLPGEVLLELNPAEPALREAIIQQGGTVADDGPNGQPAIKLANPQGKGDINASFSFPIERLRGGRLRLTAQIKAEGIVPLANAKPLLGYEGGKLQVVIDSPSLGRQYADAHRVHGTFDWRLSGAIAAVPEDATAAEIRLGIQNAYGTIQYADIRLSVLQPKPQRPDTPHPAAAQARTRYRGVMAPMTFRAEDFDAMQEWNINLVRWQLCSEWETPPEGLTYDAWLNVELDDLERALDAAQERGIRIVPVLHRTPGGRLPEGSLRMVMEQPSQEQFIRAWQTIAQRVKGHPALWGYDLVNEPAQQFPSPEGLKDWRDVQAEAARAIRAIDPDTPIVFEVDMGDSPEAFAWLEPLDLPNVIYQAHMYWPHPYSHQGVPGFTDAVTPYPGTYRDRPFNKEALRQHLQPVRDFQLATGKPIYIGEFSAARWAPGADQYLRDLIEIFEEYGWDWTYHAFREWPGWSLEHADEPRDPNNNPKAEAPPARQRVLREGFDRNKRPASE